MLLAEWMLNFQNLMHLMSVLDFENVVLCSFIQLDLGQLQVSNEFSWHGSEKDPSAVHIDVLHAEVDSFLMS